MPKISIIIPIHDMPNGAHFLWRSINAIMAQTFKDYEIVITKEGKMAENTNAGILRARGELVKILYLDDYLSSPTSLQDIVDNFGKHDHWLATGCLHQQGDGEPSFPHVPMYTHDILTGNNKIGSPSVMTFRREGALLFDENMSWLLDADLYKRYYDLYGPPKIIEKPGVIIGIGEHQMTYLMSEDEKRREYQYLANKA